MSPVCSVRYLPGPYPRRSQPLRTSYSRQSLGSKRKTPHASLRRISLLRCILILWGPAGASTIQQRKLNKEKTHIPHWGIKPHVLPDKQCRISAKPENLAAQNGVERRLSRTLSPLYRWGCQGPRSKMSPNSTAAAQTASRAIAATATPKARLARSVKAKTSGSSSSSPREASSHTRHSHKIRSGMMSQSSCG